MTEKTEKKVHLEETADGFIIIKLGASEERVVVLDDERLSSLSQNLKIAASKKPKGVIIAGPNENMFSAGADINVIQSIKSETDGERLATQGQEIFNEIENLPCPSVAAISGPCVGGACELALACTYRVISNSPKSIFGLPEVKIGILPGFGGTQRLPRLIGLQKSLEIIMEGKTPKAEQARRYGMVDSVCNYSQLIGEAKELILKGRKNKPSRQFLDLLAEKLKFVSNFVASKAKAIAIKKTGGHYPAPLAALDCVIYGLHHGIEAGLKNEARELGRMICTPQCKALTNLFFLTESAKGLGKSAREKVSEVNAIVIGAGVMGAGIAGELAAKGCQVILKDTSAAFVQKGIEQIKKTNLSRRSITEKELAEIMSRVTAATELPMDLSRTNIVIEAVFEELKVKHEVLSDLSRKVSKDAVIASNTSSLPITSVAAPINIPERVAGMHFFNPVNKMPLVEIIRAKDTADSVLVYLAALTSKLGKFPIIVNDVPGFLINRILVPYLNEAAFLLSEGVSVQDIDKAALKFGMPMGPVRLLDEVGLDVAVHVGKTMIEGYGKRMEAPDLAEKLLKLGRKGKKSGSGFYNYADKPEVPEPKLSELLGINTKSSISAEEIQNRLILRLINEAVLCLDEGVAGQPGKDAASQIDLGTVMGIGFPAFRGGLIYHANTLGPTKIVNQLLELENKYGARFRGAPGIMTRAEKGLSFYVAI